VIHLLFAQQPANMAALYSLTLGLPIGLGVAGYLFAVASPLRRRSIPATICLLGAITAAWFCWWQLTGQVAEDVLFSSFAGLIVMAACGMQVESHPVYSALWFALTILATCGLFLMHGASFISAATIIVYAGAIIVTFLFVIMMARQKGNSPYDMSLRQPLVAIASGAVLLTVLVMSFKQPMPTSSIRKLSLVSASAPTEQDADTLATLGRSLFVDHLFSVELASVLLLMAVFGTLVMAVQSREDAR
jgi:NADH-quinone oxidoreductase subunit J